MILRARVGADRGCAGGLAEAGLAALSATESTARSFKSSLNFISVSSENCQPDS